MRAFVGAPARFEDAASGAANATLAAWLAERDALPGQDGFYRVSQGREVGHDAIIELTVDADGEVWSGGRAARVVSGELVSLTDVLPTLVEMGGAKLPRDYVIDGVSLVPTLRGTSGASGGSGGEHRPWVFSYLGNERMVRDKR